MGDRIELLVGVTKLVSRNCVISGRESLSPSTRDNPSMMSIVTILV